MKMKMGDCAKMVNSCDDESCIVGNDVYCVETDAALGDYDVTKIVIR